MKPGRVLIGLALVALGILFLLDRAGNLDAGNVIADWWPVAIIGLGAVQLTESPRSILGPGIVMATGVVVLLFTTDVLEGNVFTVIWPLLLIVVGIGILIRHGRGQGTGAGVSGDDVVRSFAIFGGTELSNRSERFRGGTLTAVFGGVTLDLREARLATDGATLSVTALFGGVDVIVPRGLRMKLQGTPIFGGFEDNTESQGPPDPQAPQLTIDVLALFGGLEVKNSK